MLGRGWGGWGRGWGGASPPRPHLPGVEVRGEGWWEGGGLAAGAWRHPGWGPQRGRRAEGSRGPQGLVWGYDSRGKHDFIAEFSTTLVEMQNAFREDQVRAGRARLSPRMRWGAGPALGCPRNCCDGFREAKDGDRAGHPHPPGGWSRDHQPVLKLK